MSGAGAPAGTVHAERSDDRLWPLPAVTGAVALAAGLLLVRWRSPSGTAAARWSWPGDVDAASTLLQVVATAALTTITLTFSLTVVALQLASQQFSPRLLRDFTRDAVIKRVLAVLVATFVFAATTLRGLRADADVPGPSLLVAHALGLLSLAATVVFLAHLTRALRVDTMMRAVHVESVRAIETFYPPYGDLAARSPDALRRGPYDGVLVTSGGSGFVRVVAVQELVAAAQRDDALVWLLARPGDQVVRGTPLATVTTTAGGPLPDRLVAAVRGATVLGYERTVEQDAAFGLRQLTDIAVKALSPGINDPVTAVHAVGHEADLLVRLCGRRLGATVHLDEAGADRAVVEDRDLRYYLDLVCGQVRRYGAQEPTVLCALLRLLRDAATHVRDDRQRDEVERQVGLVLATADEALGPVEAEPVHDLAARVRDALGGEVLAAYRDRSGETRSI